MKHKVKRGETIAIIAKNYRRPIPQLQRANPSINLNTLQPGQLIEIPGLPDPNTIPFHIDVSLNNKTLTLLSDSTVIKRYPVGIGKMLSKTPVGNFVIVNREPNPGGPYGVMWLSLSQSGYGIHGTNKPSSIGKMVSKGCIRMYNQDVLDLSSRVPNGTRVTIHP